MKRIPFFCLPRFAIVQGIRNIFTILLFSAIAFMLNGQAPDEYQHKRDSLLKVIPRLEGQQKLNAYLEVTSMMTYKEEVDSVISYLESLKKEAHKQGNIEIECKAQSNIIVFLSNRSCKEEVIKRSDDVLNFLAKHESWELYYSTYRALLDAYLKTGQTEKALHETQMLLKESQKHNRPQGVSSALYEMGITYNMLDRTEEAEECLLESLKIEHQSDKITSFGLEIYFEVIKTKIALEKFDEVPILLKEWELKLKQYEEQSNDRQPLRWVNLYAMHLRSYDAKEEWDKIEPYCKLIEEIVPNSNNRKMSHAYYRTRAFMAKKNYQKAYEQISKSYDAALIVGNKQSIQVAMRYKVYLLAYLGKPEEVQMAIDQLLITADSLRGITVSAQLDELRTVYEVDKITAEKERVRKTLLLSIGGIILLLALLGTTFYLYRQKRAAYRALTERIRQWAQTAAVHEPRLLTEAEVIREAEDVEYTEVRDEAEEKPEGTDKAIGDLFEKLQHLFIKEKVYRDPDISLDSLAQRLEVNRAYLSHAINSLTGKNFSTYVNEYRVKEAVLIMSSHASDNFSIEGIAFESGFNNRKTFHQAFKKITGLSPGEFRNNLTVKL